jgi:hypothetical protein
MSNIVATVYMRKNCPHRQFVPFAGTQFRDYAVLKNIDLERALVSFYDGNYVTFLYLAPRLDEPLDKLATLHVST